MLEISNDLKVNQPIVTITGNTFLIIENYLSILEYEVDIIKVKTKYKTIKVSGDKLSLKYITQEEIGIKGLIFNIGYID